jgi:hypothetical protein
MTTRSQPLVLTRIHGRVRWHPLGRDPVADESGICWVDFFTVQWPFFVVATDAVWETYGSGDEVRSVCASSFDAAPMWVMRWRDGELARRYDSPPRTRPSLPE